MLRILKKRVKGMNIVISIRQVITDYGHPSNSWEAKLRVPFLSFSFPLFRELPIV